MARSTASLICLLLIVATAIALTRKPGTATGTLTVSGKVTRLSFAQALKTQDWVFGADNKPHLATVMMVFLSDEPADDLEDNFELSVRAKEGKLHGLLITFSEKGKPSNALLYHQSVNNGTESIFTSKFLLEKQIITDTTISGNVRTTEPVDLSAGKFSFSVTWNASFHQQPKPTVEGTAAAETPSGKAVQEFIRTAEAKDITGLKKIVRGKLLRCWKDPKDERLSWGCWGSPILRANKSGLCGSSILAIGPGWKEPHSGRERMESLSTRYTKYD